MSASLATVTFGYTGSEQTYVVPMDGWYRIELFGAGGGKAIHSGTVTASNPGKGGWSMGVAYLKKNTTLYINVGGKGADAVVGHHSAGGYNGGGNGAWDNNDDECGGAGGGATSVALVSGLLSTLSSQRDKVLIVSGGGGGASPSDGGGTGDQGYGGNAGGLSGADGGPRTAGGDYGKGGTQTTGFAFGKGEDGTDYAVANQEVAGGGGGWYGGTCGVPTASSPYLGGGGGGSSYIGGVISACGQTKGTIVMSVGGYGNGAAYIRLLMPDINKLYLSPSGTAQKVKSAVILGDGTAHHIDKLYIGDANNVPQLVWVSYENPATAIVDATGFCIWNMSDLYVGVSSTTAFSGNVTNVEISDDNSTWHNVPEDQNTGYQIMNNWVAIPSSVITSIIGTPTTIYVRVIDGNTRYSTSIS